MSLAAGSDLQVALDCLRQALGVKVSGSWPTGEASSSAIRANAIIRHRLSRLVVNSAHPLNLDKVDSDRITQDALAHTHAAFQLVSHTGRVAGILDADNIDFLVIKGVALGALSHTPAGRGAGDVDVLVAPEDAPRVHEIFLANGYRPALALPDVTKRQTWAVWSFFDREATYVGHSTHIDLHWRISSQRHLFPPFAQLYARRTEVTVADATVPTLSVADSLAAACYHAYFDQFQPLRSVLDVLSLIPEVAPESLPPSLSWRLRQLMAGVITVVREEFPGVVDAEATELLSVLPVPPDIVRNRFDDAIASPKRLWEETQDTRALWAKMRAEAPFDSPVDIIPRFIGKRLFHFAPWSDSQPHTPLPQALLKRFQVETRRRRRQ